MSPEPGCGDGSGLDHLPGDDLPASRTACSRTMDQQLEVNYILGHRLPEGTGIRRYQESLYDALRDKVRLRRIEYTVAYPRFFELGYYVRYPLKVRSQVAPGTMTHITNHYQAHILTYFPMANTVVTCLDLVPLRDKTVLGWRGKLHFALALRGMLKARRIITISEYVKRSLLASFRYPEDDIVPIPLAVDHTRFKPCNHREEVLQKYGLNPQMRHILYTGSALGRKNLPGLLDAFQALKERFHDMALLRCGTKQSDKSESDFRTQVSQRGLEKWVTHLGYVPDEDLPCFYSAADLFLFPSLEEGFGLPLLEAMACGTPVVAYNNSSIPEVAGSAGLLVDTNDKRALVEAAAAVLTDKALHQRLRKAGLKQASRFTWERTAALTLEVYESIMASEKR